MARPNCIWCGERPTFYPSAMRGNSAKQKDPPMRWRCSCGRTEVVAAFVHMPSMALLQEDYPQGFAGHGGIVIEEEFPAGGRGMAEVMRECE